MRLVSIWIENYMIIKEQGINLGDEYYFNYSFDEKSRTLNIHPEKTENYYNFFENNIVQNITGVIGINGSGKTSFLKLLNVIESSKPITHSVVLIFRDEINKTYKVYNYSETRLENKITVNIHDFPTVNTNWTIKNIKPESSKNPFKDINILFYSNLYSDQNDKYLKNYNLLNRSVDYQTQQALTQKSVTKYLNNFRKRLKRSSKNKKEDDPISFNILKIYFEEKFNRLIKFISFVNIKHPDLKEVFNEINFPEYLSLNFSEEIFDELNNLINESQYDFKEFREIITNQLNELNNDKNVKSRFRKEFVLKLFIFSFNKDYFKQTVPNTSLNELQSFIKTLKNSIDVTQELIDYLLKKKNSNKYFKISKLNQILNSFTNNKHDIDIQFDELVGFHVGAYKIRVNESVWGFIDEIFDFQEDETNSLISFRWHNLSAGEEAILNQFAELREGFDNIIADDCIVSIDEGELYLHPEWQRKYVNLLFKFFNYLSNLKNNKTRIHFIVTSHSPFLASDIPKFNLVFFTKTKDELNQRFMCIVVDPKSRMDTFGGNIFNLYSDSFFLSEFYGDFSSNLINKALDYLNGNKENSPFKNITEIYEFSKLIGEPVLKEIIQNQIRATSLSTDFEILNFDLLDKSNATKDKSATKKKSKKK